MIKIKLHQAYELSYDASKRFFELIVNRYKFQDEKLYDCRCTSVPCKHAHPQGLIMHGTFDYDMVLESDIIKNVREIAPRLAIRQIVLFNNIRKEGMFDGMTKMLWEMLYKSLKDLMNDMLFTFKLKQRALLLDDCFRTSTD